MFERFTEKARRSVFFARHEAVQLGSSYIETEHLLLAVLREDKALTNRYLYWYASLESIRKQIEERSTIRKEPSISPDHPLSNECKRVLAYAGEEAERLGHDHIGTEHLFLGLLREESWNLSHCGEVVLPAQIGSEPSNGEINVYAHCPRALVERISSRRFSFVRDRVLQETWIR